MSDPQADVDGILGGDEPEFSETPDRAMPADQVQAMRYLYRLRRTRAKIIEGDAVYEQTIAELEDARRQFLDPLRSTELWLEQALALWHHARLMEDREAKTIKLPTGTLSSSDAQPRWTYDDESAFLTWAKDHAQVAVRPPKPGEESIDKNAARAALADVVTVGNDGRVVHTETGEKIPGLLIQPGGDYDLGRFYKVKD